MPVFADQPLQQILAKAGGMFDRQPDVLVEVEQLDAAQSMSGAAVSASRNANWEAPVAAIDADGAVFGNRRAQASRRMLGRRAAHRVAIDVGLDLHVSAIRSQRRQRAMRGAGRDGPCRLISVPVVVT